MSVILQVSDPHFGTERPESVEALVRLAAHLAPDLLILSGDITQRARRSQFEAARRFVDRLPIATKLVLPGNHDLPVFDLFRRLVNPYGNYRRAFGDDLEPTIETQDLLVIGVNTTTPRRRKDGEVTARQVDRVSQRLRGARAAQLRIVVTHQPSCVARDRDKSNLLHGHEPAVRAWAGAGADIVMGGHIHLPYVWPVAERTPGLARKLWCVQAGTAVSTRVRWEADNSVNVIRYDGVAAPAHCVVERWDHGAKASLFERTQVHELELDRTEAPLHDRTAPPLLDRTGPPLRDRTGPPL